MKARYAKILVSLFLFKEIQHPLNVKALSSVNYPCTNMAASLRVIRSANNHFESRLVAGSK